MVTHVVDSSVICFNKLCTSILNDYYLTQRDLDAVISQVLTSSLLGLTPAGSDLAGDGILTKVMGVLNRAFTH